MSSRSTAKSPNNGTAPRDCLITFFETNPSDLNAVLPATVLLASRRVSAATLAVLDLFAKKDPVVGSIVLPLGLT